MDPKNDMRHSNTGFDIRPEYSGPHDPQAEADLDALFRDGAIVIPNLIPPEYCDMLKREVQSIGHAEAIATGRKEFGRRRFEGTSTKRVYGLASKSANFDRLLLHPRIYAIMERGL